MMEASAELARMKNSKSKKKRRTSGYESSNDSKPEVTTKQLKAMSSDAYEMYLARSGL